MMQTSRLRFILFLMAGSLVAIGVAFFSPSLDRQLNISSDQETVQRPPEEIRADWMRGVTAVLARYDENKDAEAAKNGLLALTVPGEQRDLHLSLVLAFQGLTTGQDKAMEKLLLARAAFAEQNR